MTGPAPAPSPNELATAARAWRSGAAAELQQVGWSLSSRYPGHELGWILLSAGFEKTGQPAQAADALARAIPLLPAHADLRAKFARLLAAAGRWNDAEREYGESLRLQPGAPAVHLGRAQALTELGRLADAERAYLAALALDPGNGQAHFSLGVLRSWQERWRAAEDAYREALRVAPASPLALDSLSYALLEQGRAEEALACAREAAALDPASPELAQNLLFTQLYAVRNPSELAPPRRLGELLAARLPPPYTQWRCAPQPPALRVGFVSGDLRSHAVANYLAAVLDAQAPGRLECIAYSTNKVEDGATAQLKKRFALWRSIADRATDDAAALVHQDGIHILVDLAGHTGHGRCDVFARKPAPVQVAWLGYLGSTGVIGMDHLLTDHACSRAGDQPWFTERLHALETWACYTPPAAPAVQAPPALRTGHVTFGSFNNLTKLTEGVVRTWARILNAVPGARLCLECRQLGQRDIAAAVARRFEACGIAAARLSLGGAHASPLQHLQAYDRIDIALDTFPFPGVTTSIEAMYMGVPVVTLRGHGGVLRVGESLAGAAGLPDWVADDEDGYVARAAQAAADLPALARLRPQLRPRLAATPFLDAGRFGADFAASLWSLWRAHHGQP